MIELINISKEFGEKQLFHNLTLNIYDGERVGIVGSNGTGKSTLFNIIAGKIMPDEGCVNTGNSNIGYLQQSAFYTNDDFIKLSYDKEVISDFLKIKSKLNISDNIDFSKARFTNLSGGEKTKLMLAHVLSLSPDILLLDEPTNHIDEASINWLIETLSKFKGTLLSISHDRYFLNKTTDKIIELENGKATEYYGNYDEYKRQKNEELSSLQMRYKEQNELEKSINKQIDTLSSWANKGESTSRRQGGMMSDSRIKGAQTKAQTSATKLASSAKAKIARLEQQKENFIDRPYEDRTIKYFLEPSTIGAKMLISAKNISKSFDKRVLFKDSNFEILKGEKIAITGCNGSGKTTLINLLLGTEPVTSGEIWRTPSLKPALLSQDVFDLDQAKTVKEMAMENDGNYRTLFLTNLINMNISRQTFDRKIKTLSLGERMRIKLCKLILSDNNMIILDEPTNHLDIANKEELEKVLKGYSGSLLLISHDKYFRENVVDFTLNISGEQILKKKIEHK